MPQQADAHGFAHPVDPNADGVDSVTARARHQAENVS